MARLAIILAIAFAAAVCAQEAYEITSVAFDDTRCTAGWKKVDETAKYNANVTAMTRVCVRDYMEVCIGAGGLEVCNPHNAECRDVLYDFADRDLYPGNVLKNGMKPQVCVSKGSLMAPDFAVVCIAQVIFALVFYTIAIVFAFKMNRGMATFDNIAIVSLQLAIALLLSLSYYYLNGLIQFGASIAALGLFRARTPLMTGLGALVILSALFWTTYASGLGYAQHHSRFGPVSNAQSAAMCNSYYRDYFVVVPELQESDYNPEIYGWGLCSNQWIAAVLFFQFLSQILLVVQVGAGARNLLFVEEVVTAAAVSETEPAQ